ncbi:MAG: DUF2914 domain-containing protein [Candidatus Aminicenantes bacterium]|nr:DUF2914 domain-containing protein [Candidatus Aminicenantes bacterium]
MKFMVAVILVLIVFQLYVLPLEVSRMVLTRDIKNSEPADSDSIFFLVENSIFCFTEFVNIKKTTRIIHKWFCGNRLVGNVVLTLKPGKRWRTWSRKSFKNCRGEWKIQICESKGKIIAEKKFIVKKI